MVAVLVLSILFLRPAQRPQRVRATPHDPSSNQAQTGSKPQEATAQHDRLPKREAVAHKERHAGPLLAQRDRPSVFPTPTGLSEQEKLMLAYIAQTPKEEVIAQLQRPQPEEEEFWKDQQPAVVRPQR